MHIPSQFAFIGKLLILLWEEEAGQWGREVLEDDVVEAECEEYFVDMEG